MKRLPILLFILFSSSVTAELSTEQKIEIDHLLQFVKNSACKVDRNGSFHDGKDVVSHIQKKYNYFEDDIETAEDFIKYSATKSTMSGRHYTAKCGDKKPIKTKDWLLIELREFRSNQLQPVS